MDFVTAVKASSIVLTGGFGILGLVKDFKDKKTHRVTKWGYVSLVGIVLSTVFGVAAQLVESSKAEKEKQRTANETLLLAQKTDRAVKEIQRVLSPLDDPTIAMFFHIPCSNKQFVEFCKSHWNKRTAWEKWPEGPPPTLLLNVDFFRDANAAQRFLDGRADRGDLSLSVIADARKDSLGEYSDGTDTGLDLRVGPHTTPSIYSNGGIRSVIDLPGVTMIITESGHSLEVLELNEFDIQLKNGEVIKATRFDKVMCRGRGAYRYKFPAQRD